MSPHHRICGLRRKQCCNRLIQDALKRNRNSWNGCSGIVDVFGGDKGGGGETTIVSIFDRELPLPMLAFYSILDMFSGIFKILSSSILESQIGTSGGVTVVSSGSKVIIGSP